MPVTVGRDSKGSYYKWGTKGKHYYYNPMNEASRKKARRKAIKQGIAIKLRLSR